MSTTPLLLVLLLLGSPAFAEVLPTRYDLTLAPDLAADRFTGSVRIEVELRAPTDHIRLDAVGLEVQRVSLSSAGRARGVRWARTRDALIVRADRPLPPGPTVVEVAWRGRLSHALRGLYVANDGARRYVLTQLEPTSAREVFPCFDDPALRARVRLRAVVGADEVAISNGAVVSETVLGGRRLVEFAETPPIPTYLVALAVGDFESVEDTGAHVPLRVLAPPGHHTDATAALRAAAALLAQLESSLGVPFPFAKLDIVAAPQLAAHGMENAGAIFIRANELLDGGEEQVRRLAHELAHQWFGGLVTMSSWRDLWLTEALARLLEFDVVDALHPEWRMWRRFHALEDAALALDARPGAHPIRALAPRFDPIVYDKGAAVLRMLRSWTGEQPFGVGLRDYLEHHAFASAGAADFWRALAAHTRDDIASVGTSWLDQAGHPTVDLTTRCSDGVLRIRVAQHRDGGEPRHQVWQVPLVLLTPTDRLRLLLRRPTASLLVRDGAGCPLWVKADTDGDPPYRVHDRRR